MLIPAKSIFLPVVLLPLLFGGGAQAASITKRASLDAFSVWRTDAQIVQTGDKRASLVGTLGGALFIETDEGPRVAGGVDCPARIDLNKTDGSERGQGSCTFTADDGSKAFGDWKCDGSTAEGCSGQFAFTGGTGRFVMIKGGSDILFLAHEADFEKNSTGSVDSNIEGITVWPELTASVRQVLAEK